MKTNTSWEDKLKAKLGEDRERFPLPGNHFASLKEQILSEKEASRKSNAASGKIKPLWLLVVPVAAAAAVAVFLLSRQGVPVQPPPDNLMLSDAAEVYFEITTSEPVQLEVDSHLIKKLSNEPVYQEMKTEVIYEEYLDDYVYEADEQDPLDQLAVEDIEDYLVENININSEL
ncbi:MAG: hypothetical protein GC180_07840 [Bacteroidetes bacterium]|nr:hypothetical protein [Bacteroidota bacterium]